MNRTFVLTLKESLGLFGLLLHPSRARPQAVYDLLATHNNLAEDSLYLNLGYWKDATTYDAACQALAEVLGSAAQLGAGDEVLDAGFGFGDQDRFWMQRFGPKRILGINVTESQVEHAKARHPIDGVEFTVASGSTKADIETAVNLQSDATGIDADLDGGVLYFRSADYGSAQTASIDVTAGTFALDGGTTSDTGVDATVTVNDQTATADGLQIYFSSGNTSVRFSLQEAFGTVGGGSSTFSITGGGADWQLDANPINQIHFGMSSLNTSYLGNDTLGYIRSIKSGGANALSSGNYQAAGNIATAASQQVATDRARLGAVQTYTVNSTLSAFASTKTALSSARSSIMDLDYAAETANNDRLQALMNIGMSVLATLSQNTNSILTLLRT